MFETLLENLAERFVEDGLPILAGAAATVAGAVVAALAGYAVYRIAVKLLDETTIRTAIADALAGAREKIGQRQLKAAVRELVDAQGTQAAHVTLDVLDTLSGSKQAEVCIEYEEIRGIQQGDVIEDIQI